MGVFGVDVEQRFEASYIPEPMSGCWLWVGNLHPVSGHGRIGVNGKSEYAHRVSYVINGKIIDDEVVRHTCDVAYCVNPDHLVTGSRTDNMDDMYRRGRSYAQNQIHCKQGHEFTPENTRVTARQRVCITCARERGREWARKNRGK